ncbi:phage head-tail connector protein [Geobacillus thermodenitrificans]|uniref:phage head-tail connector protein n=1 Tax=Geobacillus thermodenitrificans TaxID=33940 RepID=UPI0024C54A2B|nr:head-tail connector protein [Geobacillus phage vB_GthS_PK5.2]
MNEQTLQQLLSDLKERLRITWDEEDWHLRRLIQQSETYLSELTNASFNFLKEEWPKEILLERCRYVYNNAGDEFEINFHHELSRLILSVAIGKVGVVRGSETVSGDV